MAVNSITKVLGAEQDLALGTGKDIQTRGGASVSVDKLNIAKTISDVSIFANTSAASEYVDPTKFSLVNIMGYATENDGGEGLFYWDSTASITGADSGTAFTSGVVPTIGLWRRIGTDTEEVNVKWFGAQGDGATDDTAAVTLAISYANALLKSILYFPRGTYNLTSTIDLSASEAISVKGDGRQLTLLNYIGNVTPGIKIDTGNEVHKEAQYSAVRDFTMVTDNLTSVGILIISTMSLTDIVQASLIKDIMFVGDSTTTAWHNCIKSQDARGITVKHCLGLGPSGGSAGNSFWFIDNTLALSTDFYTFFDVEANEYATETSGLTPTGGNIQANLLDGSVTNAKIADNTIEYIKFNTGITASQAEALAGTSNTKIMTPLRVKQARISSGLLLQQKMFTTDVETSSTTYIPADATIPQITEGEEIFAEAITPLSATGKIEISGFINFTQTNGFVGAVCLFQDAIADAIAVNIGGDISGLGYGMPFCFIVNSVDLTARTYRIRVGSSGGTFYVNRNVTADLFGAGKLISALTVREIEA